MSRDPSWAVADAVTCLVEADEATGTSCPDVASETSCLDEGEANATSFPDVFAVAGVVDPADCTCSSSDWVLVVVDEAICLVGGHGAGKTSFDLGLDREVDAATSYSHEDSCSSCHQAVRSASCFVDFEVAHRASCLDASCGEAVAAAA